MRTVRISAIAIMLIGTGAAWVFARQQPAPSQQTNRAAPSVASTIGSAPLRETVTAGADVPIPKLAGKRLVSRIVDYPPGAASIPHHHADSAFIYAYVLSGTVRSQVNDEPARVYRTGETWFEAPGSYHRVSENASATEPAKLLAVFIIDASDKQLTIPDRH
jgi:quercetin dioxygenase-like cupin family protein